MARQQEQASHAKNISQGMLGIIILMAFAIPLLWIVHTKYLKPTLLERRVQWQAVAGELESVSSDSSTSRTAGTIYIIEASYSYTVDGETLYGNRVGFAEQYRKTSSSQANDVVRSLQEQSPLTVYVDPRDPSTSVLLKDASGRLPTFAAIVFGVPGVGLVLCAIYVLVVTVREAVTT